MYLVIQIATAATPLHQKWYGGKEDLKKTTNFITAAGLVVLVNEKMMKKKKKKKSQMACSTLITSIALVTINFQFKDDNCDPVPRWLVVTCTYVETCKEAYKVHDVTAVEHDGIGDDIKRETKPPTLIWK